MSFPPYPWAGMGASESLVTQNRRCSGFPCHSPSSGTHSGEVGEGSLTSSVSYMVRFEEKGEGSGCRSSHRFSVDSSRSRPFSEVVSHCVPPAWGFRVTTTLPGHRPVSGLPPPAAVMSPAAPFSTPLTEVGSTWPECSWGPELWRRAGRGQVASLHLHRFLEGTGRTGSHCCLSSPLLGQVSVPGIKGPLCLCWGLPQLFPGHPYLASLSR